SRWVLSMVRVHTTRFLGEQDQQDVPGDVEAGRGRDPGGAGQGGRRLAALLQHRPGSDGRGGPGGDGGPGGARADEQGRERGVGRRPAAGAQRVQQRGVLQPEPVAVLAGGGLGVGQGGGRAGGPQRQPVGRRAEAAFASGQAQGAAEGGVARGNTGGSGGHARRGTNPRP